MRLRFLSVLSIAFALICNVPSRADFILWDGGAGTDSWHDAENWQNDQVPGAGDDVIIIGDFIDVKYSEGVTAVNSILVSPPSSFYMAGGELHVEEEFRVDIGDFYFEAGFISRPVLVVSGGIGFADNPVGTVEVHCTNSAFLDTGIPPGQLIRVFSGPPYGPAVLVTDNSAPESVNHGTISLETQGGEWDAVLRLGGSFRNASDGTILIPDGTGGQRSFEGGFNRSFTNEGTIVIGDNSSLLLDDLEEAHFASGDVQGGEMVAAVDTDVRLSGGTFTGDLLMEGGFLLAAASYTPTQNVIIHDFCNVGQLDATGLTLKVEATDLHPTARLRVGNIESNCSMELLTTMPGQTAEIEVLADQQFTNGEEGTIAAHGPGASVINGLQGWRFTNTGTMVIGDAEQLEVGGADSFPGEFHQAGGSLVGPGELAVNAVSLRWSGGTQDAPVVVTHGSIQVDDTAVEPVTIVARGETALVALDAAGTTVIARADPVVGHVTMSVDDVENAGTIRLESTGDSLECRLVAGASTAFTNLESGLIEFDGGNGGVRSIEAVFSNSGTLRLPAVTPVDILGNAIFMSTSSMEVEVQSGTEPNEPRLRVDGDVALDGFLGVRVEGGGIPALGTTLPIVAATGRLTGMIQSGDLCPPFEILVKPEPASVAIEFTTGDFNDDRIVGVEDLLQLLEEWGACPGDDDCCAADIDRSGFVDVADLLALLANWT